MFIQILEHSVMPLAILVSDKNSRARGGARGGASEPREFA